MTKVALVTGAGSGIGKAIAVLLASCGSKVGVLGHTEAEIAVTTHEISAGGGEAILLRADLSNEQEGRHGLVARPAGSMLLSPTPASIACGRRSMI